MSRRSVIERRRQRDRRKRSRYVRELFASALCAFEHVEGTMNVHPFWDLVQTKPLQEQIENGIRRAMLTPFEERQFIVNSEQLKKLLRLFPMGEMTIVGRRAGMTAEAARLALEGAE